MITPEDIKALNTPSNLSKLLGGYDKILEAHAVQQGVGEAEFLCFKRFIEEYKKSKVQENYPYYFDASEAEDVIDISDRLLFYDSGRICNFKLLPFQRFIILNLYGWRCKDDNSLRYRMAYISIGRRNGKSLLCSVLAIYYLVFSHFKSARGIIISLTKEHAYIVFKQITDFMNADLDLQELNFIDTGNGKMRCKGTQNQLLAFSGIADKDGFTSNFAISDEQNASDGQLPQLIMDGQADQGQALFIGISTASFLIGGWGHKNYKRWRKQLEVGKIDPVTFLYICEPDKPQDNDLRCFENEYAWLQANPYLLWNSDGTPNKKRLEMYRIKCNEAFSIGGDKLVSFVTKQCNTWCANQDMAFCDYAQLEKNARQYTFEEVCRLYKIWYLGIDLGGTKDFSSVTWGAWIWEDAEQKLLPPGSKGFKRIYFHTIQFTPKGKFDVHIKSDKFNYRLYEGKEIITVEGDYMNFKAIYDYIEKVMQANEITYKTISADPYNLSSIQQNLEGIAEWVIQQNQTPKALSQYLEQLQGRINCGDVVYTDGCEELFKRATLWSRVSQDSNGYYFVEKATGNDTSNMRIDSIDSLLNMVIAPLIEENRNESNGDVIIDEWMEMFNEV